MFADSLALFLSPATESCFFLPRLSSLFEIIFTPFNLSKVRQFFGFSASFYFLISKVKSVQKNLHHEAQRETLCLVVKFGCACKVPALVVMMQFTPEFA